MVGGTGQLGMIAHICYPSCSGLQTVAPEPANTGHFRLTFSANRRACEPTLTANEPTFRANRPQTAR
jgi:hypothetical protein